MRIPVSIQIMHTKGIKKYPVDNSFFIDIPTDRSDERTLDNVCRRLREIIIKDLVHGFLPLFDVESDTTRLPFYVHIVILFKDAANNTIARFSMDPDDFNIPNNDRFNIFETIQLLTQGCYIDVLLPVHEDYAINFETPDIFRKPPHKAVMSPMNRPTLPKIPVLRKEESVALPENTLAPPEDE